MGCENLPIQMIVHYDEKGTVRPLRFQVRDGRNKTYTIQIEQVVDCRKTKDAQEDVMMYLCKVVVRGEPCLFELKFRINTQQWLLFRQIY